MDRELAAELPEPDDVDQIIVLRNIPWNHYTNLLRDRGLSRRPRMVYLDRTLEIMTTSMPHELVKTLLARLVEAYAGIHDLSFNGAGQTTFRKKAKRAGLEPDECYFVGKARVTPTLAIEIIHRSGGIDKLEVYRRLGVSEVWFWKRDRISVYRFSRNEYIEVDESEALPGIDLRELERIIATADPFKQTKIVERYRTSLALPAGRAVRDRR